MTLALAIIGTVCLAGGVFFCVVGGIGLLRLPDFYSRCHGAGMTDSAGAAGVLVGLCFFAEPLVIVKLLTVVAFIWLSSVVSTHALVKAAYARGIRLENPRVRDWTVRPDKSAQSEEAAASTEVPKAAKVPAFDMAPIGESESQSESESESESESQSQSQSQSQSDAESESESESESQSDAESESDAEDDDDGEARS